MKIKLLQELPQFPGEAAGTVLNTPEYVARALIAAGTAVDCENADCNSIGEVQPLDPAPRAAAKTKNPDKAEQ